jgi:hypothetical protein
MRTIPDIEKDIEEAKKELSNVEENYGKNSYEWVDAYNLYYDLREELEFELIHDKNRY